MGGLKCNRLLKMLIVACTYNTPRGPSAARRWNLKTMTMQNNVCHGRPSKKKTTYTKSKQTSTICTQRPSVNKERYLFVLHLSSERQSWGPVHSCSSCAVSGLHQAGAVPKACTGRPGYSLTSGLHRREGSFPLSDFLFIYFITASLSISVYPSLSLLVTPSLSHFPLLYFLYPSMEGPTSRSR